MRRLLSGCKAEIQDAWGDYLALTVIAVVSVRLWWGGSHGPPWQYVADGAILGALVPYVLRHAAARGRRLAWEESRQTALANLMGFCDDMERAAQDAASRGLSGVGIPTDAAVAMVSAIRMMVKAEAARK